MGKTTGGNNTDDESKKNEKAGLQLPAFNPISRYEEKVIVPYLTVYDIERKPREMRSGVCKLPLNSVNTLFQCPVCLGYLKKTYIVMECLHRFCKDCIQKCLRLGKKECPSCRVHIPSRRSLRPDLNYDGLIKNMFGDIEALEDQEDQEIENFNKRNHMNNAYTQRRNIEISKQAKLRKKGGNKPEEQSATEVAIEENVEAEVKYIPAGIRNLEESKLLDFILRIHPQEKRVRRLHREAIRTSGEITIGQLKKFLGRKLGYKAYYHFQIILSFYSGKQVALDDEITLKEVQYQISDRRRTVMMLFYRLHTMYS